MLEAAMSWLTVRLKQLYIISSSGAMLVVPL